ncbi:hypothetical protein SAM23877_4344 [Streptomyces ambofaciens ATCC 23877]|uniref:Uncharacterized protein n=1 Tax=Streptomyces ambofaciens (strain ATCC 23877 / 3486 / DSM 40053 / JCM 4204 / NBRC 12836 / NRRL B-2516) TaxID=278992 RepID=A0A0K2AWJ3_STRA7|nr:hypothetical protein SAM23877_4344 [Streptomyces ambofaciens ATCC 23877]
MGNSFLGRVRYGSNSKRRNSLLDSMATTVPPPVRVLPRFLAIQASHSCEEFTE